MVSPQRLANTYDSIAGQLLKAMIEASKIPSVKRFLVPRGCREMHAGGLAEGVTRLPEKGGLRCAKRTYLGNRIPVAIDRCCRKMFLRGRGRDIDLKGGLRAQYRFKKLSAWIP
jgi:hypothetical protein